MFCVRCGADVAHLQMFLIAVFVAVFVSIFLKLWLCKFVTHKSQNIFPVIPFLLCLFLIGFCVCACVSYNHLFASVNCYRIASKKSVHIPLHKCVIDYIISEF